MDEQFYRVPGETIKDLDCIMNDYLVHIVPWDYWLPTALLTNNWCDDYKSTINANKTLGELRTKAVEEAALDISLQ